MTRLIDADNIEYDKMICPVGNGMYVDSYVVDKKDIDVIPTIDAIPVEWITRYMNHADITSVVRIKVMVDVWREEHEGI